MIPQQKKNSELDRLMRDALTSNEDLIVPFSLSYNTIHKLKKKALLRELVFELLFKIGIASGSLVILAGVFAWTNGTGVLTGLVTQIVSNWKIITSLLFLVFITIFIDQVGLRFYNTFSKEARLKIR